jgi:hypothetical protein
LFNNMQLITQLFICSLLLVNLEALGYPGCDKPLYEYCKSVDSANACGVFEECLDTWQAIQTYPYVNFTTPRCNASVTLLNISMKAIMPNNSQLQYNYQFHVLCEKLRKNNSALLPVCREIETHYLSDAFEMLSRGIDVKIVAKLMSFCNESKILRYSPGMDLYEPACENCKALVNITGTYIEANIDDFVSLSDSICKNIVDPSNQYNCSGVVEAQLRSGIHYLFDNIGTDQICKSLNQCGNKAIKVPTSIDEKCEACKLVLEQLEQLIYKYLPDINETLLDFCNRLPLDKVVQCRQNTVQYLPYVVEYLFQSYNKEEVCKEARMCPLEGKTSLLKDIKNRVLKEMKHRVLKAIKNRIFKDQRKHLVLKDKKSECIQIVDEIKKFVADNETQTLIALQVKDIVCQNRNQMCDDIIDALVPYMSVHLNQEINSTMLCENYTLLHFFKIAASIKCKICTELVADKIKHLDIAKLSEKFVETVNKSVCQHMSENVRSMCTDLAQRYFTEAIKIALADLDPTKICTLAGACP